MIKVTYSSRKVSLFTGFYHDVDETLTVLLLTRMKTTFCINIGTQNNTYKISRENFCGF